MALLKLAQHTAPIVHQAYDLFLHRGPGDEQVYGFEHEIVFTCRLYSEHGQSSCPGHSCKSKRIRFKGAVHPDFTFRPQHHPV